MNLHYQDDSENIKVAVKNSQEASKIAVALGSKSSQEIRESLSVQLMWKQLQWFSTSFPNLDNILSSDIFKETLNEVDLLENKQIATMPTITYIIPVYNCDPELLTQSVKSLVNQIAVKIKAIFIIDGESGKDAAAIANSLAGRNQSISTKIIQHESNQGVAAARNTGMKQITTEFFSWLDANDIIHPLRSIHGILCLINKNAIRINTSYSRVMLKTGKIVLRNQKYGHTGHTSFIARREILNAFGYLVNLKAHEDTEYQRRLEYFNANMCSTQVIGHYLDLNPGSSSHLHLSYDTWEGLEIIEGHSYLGATYTGKATPERLLIMSNYNSLYEKLIRESLTKYFPADFNSA